MIKYPDYNNSIVNLACSVLKHYGAEYKHPTLPLLDRLLERNYKNVVVMLFDGMGVDALRQHLPKDSFLRRNLKSGISSVFPPTTAAATTSIESGLAPVEHGWLGWCLYFNEIDKIVNIFINTLKDSEEAAAAYHVAGRYIPYKSIYQSINETGKAKAFSVSPFGSNVVTSLDEMSAEVKRLCSQQGRNYIYTYWEDPDKTMHTDGCYSASVTSQIKEIDSMVSALCSELTDTLVIVTADHGHINLTHKIICDYPTLANMLRRPTAIESRALSFYIKEEYKDIFPKEFGDIFGEDFILLSQQEVIDKKLFGEGTLHPKFKEFIGDYLAIAISDKGIAYSSNSRQFKADHAGLTEQEMIIPFISVECN